MHSRLMGRLTSLVVVFLTALGTARSAAAAEASNVYHQLNVVEQAISNLREEQRKNDQTLQMLRDGTAVMMPFKFEAQGGTRVTGPEKVMRDPGPADPKVSTGTGDGTGARTEFIPIKVQELSEIWTRELLMRELDRPGPIDWDTLAQRIGEEVSGRVRELVLTNVTTAETVKADQARVNKRLLTLMALRAQLLEEAKSAGGGTETKEVTGADLAGTWRRSDGLVVKVEGSGGYYTGTIVTLPNPQATFRRAGFFEGEEVWNFERGKTPGTYAGKWKYRYYQGTAQGDVKTEEMKAVTLKFTDNDHFTPDDGSGAMERVVK